MLKNLIAGLSLGLGLSLFYYNNFYKKYDYSFFTSSIVDSNVEKIKNVEIVFSDIYKDGKLSKLQNEKEKAIFIFLDKVTIFQKNIVQNSYPTLQALLSDFLKTYNNKDYKEAALFIEKMKTIIRDSSLPAGTKIDLFTELKDFSQSLNDIIKFNSEISSTVLNSEKLLNNSIEDFSKDTVINNATDKIKKIENTKYLLNIFAFCLIIFGFINFFIEYLFIRKNIEDEVSIITETCNSITKGSDADVLLKLKKLRYFKKLKNNIFETIKLLSNKLEFYKDFISELNIPILFKDDDGNVIKNTEYSKIESNSGNNFFIKNDKYYEKEIQGGCEYFCYVSKDNIRKNLDKDIILDIKSADYSKISPELKELVVKIKESEVENTKYISKYNKLISRTKSVINRIRVKDLEDKNQKKLLEDEIENLKEAALKTIKISEKIVELKDTIEVFVNNHKQIEAVIENINVNKDYFNKDIESLVALIYDFNYSQKLIDAYYKNILLKKDSDTNSLLEIKARLALMNSELTKIKQAFFKYGVSQNQSNSIDKNKLKSFELFYNELFLDLESNHIITNSDSLSTNNEVD